MKTSMPGDRVVVDSSTIRSIGAHVAKWNDRRSDLLVGETTGELLSEVDIDSVGSERNS